MNDGDDREKHDQQRRERQRLLERMAEPMLLGDTVKRGRDDDDHQADDADLGEVKPERDHQDHGAEACTIMTAVCRGVRRADSKRS